MPSTSTSFPNARRSLAIGWRTLRSMRTALVLLLLLAIAAVAGSLVPQIGVSPARVAATFRDHPLRADVYNRLGLFDVYGSWWFTLIYSLLLVSLVACLVPRTRALLRNLRARPQPAREIETMRHYAERTVPAEPGPAIAGARRVLRRRMFRTSRPGPTQSIAAEKGLARDAGSLLFHWSFLLILAGIVYGKGTGFTGQAVIVEGQTWTEAGANYDGTLRPGRFFSADDHTGIQVHVRDFEVVWRPSGMPQEFTTSADLTDPRSGESKTVDIRVNHPGGIGGVKIFQYGFGWAPVLEVRDGEKVISAAPVPLTQDPPPEGVGQMSLPWRGVVKLASTDPQVGIELDLWPDSRALAELLSSGRAPPMLDAHEPVLTYTAYRGDLRLDRVQNVTELDKAGLRKWKTGVIGEGEVVKLGDGLTVSFPELRQYTVLQVGRDRGLWIMLVASILVLAGLIPSLYSSRRKLWVRAEPNGSGTVLRIGGFALQRRSQFESEFARLVEELAGESERKVGTK